MISIRYIVNEVDESVEFYRSNFDFKLIEQYGPAVAVMERDGVQLILSGPIASASSPMPDGTIPSPGGWARFQVIVDNIERAQKHEPPDPRTFLTVEPVGVEGVEVTSGGVYTVLTPMGTVMAPEDRDFPTLATWLQFMNESADAPKTEGIEP